MEFVGAFSCCQFCIHHNRHFIFLCVNSTALLLLFASTDQAKLATSNFCYANFSLAQGILHSSLCNFVYFFNIKNFVFSVGNHIMPVLPLRVAICHIALWPLWVKIWSLTASYLTGIIDILSFLAFCNSKNQQTLFWCCACCAFNFWIRHFFKLNIAAIQCNWLTLNFGLIFSESARKWFVVPLLRHPNLLSNWKS